MEFSTAFSVGAVEFGAFGWDASLGEDVTPFFAWFEAGTGNDLVVAGEVRLLSLWVFVLVFWAWGFVTKFLFLSSAFLAF